MAKIHKSSMVYLDSKKPVVLNMPERVAGLHEHAAAQAEQAAVQAVQTHELAKLQAARLLQDAKTKADQQLLQARHEAGQIRETAYHEGFRAGQFQADQEKTLLEQKLALALEQKFSEQDKAQAGLFQEFQDAVLDLSLQIAEKVIKLELGRNDAAFLGLVQEAASRFKPNETLSVHTSKNDYWRSLVSSIYAQSENITLLADDSLPNGSCIVESTSGILDASVDIQLKQIQKDLKEHVR